MKQVERWGVLELVYHGKSDGNPFLDYELMGIFSGEKETVSVRGFYDGEGCYRIRFMPRYEGVYHYQVSGNCFMEEAICGEPSDLLEGDFQVIAPSYPNHGPVRVKNGRYLAYEDGTTYHSIGTTCYAWVNQEKELQVQTLQTLEKSCFNKLRFCIFPKYYQYNENEPFLYPYERGNCQGIDSEKLKKMTPTMFPQKKEAARITDFDCYRLNPSYFQMYDRQIQKLGELGIEADLILFHPYDKWGFAAMNQECNELYLRYVAARYGAYRHVWWSMSNEYDFLPWTVEEWDHYGTLVYQMDPYRHMLSIHNALGYYDYTKEWLTHCSLQRMDFYKHVEETDALLDRFEKPVVWDEIAYEGNIDLGWGNITGQELVRRFWEAVLRGGCAGHGETFVHPQDILWWSHGGVLHGESEPRLKFLKDIWDHVPGGELKRGEGMFDEVAGIPVNEFKPKGAGPAVSCGYELHYLGFTRPSYRVLFLPEDRDYRIEVIDTWEMTITDAGIHRGMTRIELPGKQWMAIRLTAV